MKQSEYLRELKENLETRVSPEELKDILSDYESFFVSGKEDGKNDEEISKELGSPAFLAKSLLEEHSGKVTVQQDKRITNSGRRISAYLIDMIIAVIPALIMSLVIGMGTIALPFLLFITYPSPAVGATTYISFAAFTTGTASEVTRVTTSEVKQNGENVDIVEKGINENNMGNGKQPSLITSIIAGLSLAFYLFYSFVCTLIFRGQTIGKKLLHIKVRRSNTALVGSGAIFCREFLGKTLINSIPIIPLISFFTILFTKEHQALHDMLGDTIVSDV
ncbi:MAG TPA: DUF1700 domain-containing protein [Ruminiclostridium sp.]